MHAHSEQIDASNAITFQYERKERGRLVNWQWIWLVAMFFGVLQIPWSIAVAIRVADLQSARPVEFWRDSLLDWWELAFTIPALLFGLIGVYVCWRNFNRGGIILCAIVVLASVMILVITGSDWYENVYCGSGKMWGWW